MTKSQITKLFLWQTGFWFCALFFGYIAFKNNWPAFGVLVAPVLYAIFTAGWFHNEFIGDEKREQFLRLEGSKADKLAEVLGYHFFRGHYRKNEE